MFESGSQVTRRSMTPEEMGWASNAFKVHQNVARAFGILTALIIAIYAATTMNIIDFGTLSIFPLVGMLVLGVASIAVSAKVLKVRKKVVKILEEGMAYEVTGMATTGTHSGGMRFWTIGPLALSQTNEVNRSVREGMQATVLCIPEIKHVLSINNINMRQGNCLVMVPNLEALAVRQAPSAQEFQYPPPPPPMGR